MRRWNAIIGVGLLCAMVLPPIGCRSRAKQDLFVQQLTRELRDREDELYEADYENRVLSDKYERTLQAKQRLESQLGKRAPITLKEERKTPLFSEVLPSPSPDSEVNRPGLRNLSPQAPPLQNSIDINSDEADEFDLGDGLDGIDFGEAYDPDEPVFGQPGAPEVIGPGIQNDDSTLLLPGEELLPQPPPQEPEPPGRRDTEFAPIEEGEIIPPRSQGPEVEIPGGRINLPPMPDSLQENLGNRGNAEPVIPTALALHPGFSMAYQFNSKDQVDGLMLVVNVLDEQGRMIDLEAFEIAADLTIIAMPVEDDSVSTDSNNSNSDEAENDRPEVPEIARWEFTSEEVRDLVQQNPVSGFHVPVLWDDEVPKVEKVLIHVVLQTEDERMICQGIVDVSRQGTVAQWTPRGEAIRTGKRTVAGSTTR